MKTTLSLIAFVLASLSLHAAEIRTLRSFGAVGDGQTDDRAAIEQALKQSAGQSIDGEGLTYAVNGSVRAGVPVELHNLTLRQTKGSFDTSKYIRSTSNAEPPQVTPPDALTRMVHGVPWLRFDGVARYAEDPVVTGPDREALREMLNIRTLSISGTKEQPVSVKLENVKILRGDHADAGMHSNAAGLYLVYASPLSLTNIDISGDGKGAGLFINNCSKARLDRVSIHDIRWAPFQGDPGFTGAVLRDDFGWNNSPIYDFDDRAGRFIRVRIQEQLAGLVIGVSEDIEITNSRIERIGTTIDGKFLPWQADGVTVGAVQNLTMRDCVITQVWEGIDLTGKGVDGFVQENIRISDTFSYGFKYAHPQKNGKVINCVSERAGMTGFIIGDECENIVFTGCQSLETGASGYWTKGEVKKNVSGFRLIGGKVDATLPRGVRIENCSAINKEFPGAMAYGFHAERNATFPGHHNELIHPVTEGYKLGAVEGFPGN